MVTVMILPIIPFRISLFPLLFPLFLPPGMRNALNLGIYIKLGPMFCLIWWIGSRENWKLQETLVFSNNYRGFISTIPCINPSKQYLGELRDYTNCMCIHTKLLAQLQFYFVQWDLVSTSLCIMGCGASSAKVRIISDGIWPSPRGRIV